MISHQTKRVKKYMLTKNKTTVSGGGFFLCLEQKTPNTAVLPGKTRKNREK